MIKLTNIVNELGINKLGPREQIIKSLEEVIKIINQIQPTPDNIDLEGIVNDLENHIFELTQINKFEYYEDEN